MRKNIMLMLLVIFFIIQEVFTCQASGSLQDNNIELGLEYNLPVKKKQD